MVQQHGVCLAPALAPAPAAVADHDGDKIILDGVVQLSLVALVELTTCSITFNVCQYCTDTTSTTRHKDCSFLGKYQVTFFGQWCDLSIL